MKSKPPIPRCRIQIDSQLVRDMTDKEISELYDIPLERVAEEYQPYKDPEDNFKILTRFDIFVILLGSTIIGGIIGAYIAWLS